MPVISRPFVPFDRAPSAAPSIISLPNTYDEYSSDAAPVRAAPRFPRSFLNGLVLQTGASRRTRAFHRTRDNCALETTSEQYCVANRADERNGVRTVRPNVFSTRILPCDLTERTMTRNSYTCQIDRSISLASIAASSVIGLHESRENSIVLSRNRVVF